MNSKSAATFLYLLAQACSISAFAPSAVASSGFGTSKATAPALSASTLSTPRSAGDCYHTQSPTEAPSEAQKVVAPVLLLADGGQSGGGGGDPDGINAMPVLGSLASQESSFANLAQNPNLKVFITDLAAEKTPAPIWTKDKAGITIPNIYISRKDWLSKDLAGREAMLRQQLCLLGPEAARPSCQGTSDNYEASRRVSLQKIAAQPIDCTFTLFDVNQTHDLSHPPKQVRAVLPAFLTQSGNNNFSLQPSNAKNPIPLSTALAANGKLVLNSGEGPAKSSMTVFDPMNDPQDPALFTKDQEIEGKYLLRSSCARR